MDGKSSSEDRERLREAVQASRAAAKEATKDASGLLHQAAVLKSEAAEIRLEAQEARAQARLAGSPLVANVPFTIPEAAARLHVAERTLRHVLSEPDWHARLIERTRKVGIYYKFIPLVSPDLMADLVSHFAEHKLRKEKSTEDEGKQECAL